MNLNRRQFLGASSAFTVPFLFNGCATGFKANDKINVGVVGIGRISTTMDIPLVLKHHDLCRIVAVCDLDSKRLAHGKKFVGDLYAKQGRNEDIKTYSDYHEMFADPSIDAVELCLPDHWHALAAVEAILAGKHVWLQKPFAQTIREGRIIANLAREKNIVMQVGSWQRSVRQFQQVCELVQNGRIGEIARVEVGIGLDKSGGCRKAEPVPANLDYDRWLGPTDPSAPYNWTRVHQQDLKRIGDRPGWIQLEPYGWGMITNWGAHHLDITQWGLGKDLSGPEGVSGTCEWMDLSGDKLWNVHTAYDLHYSYNGGRTDVHVCNKYQNGVKFVGKNGDWLFCSRGAVKVTPSDPDDPNAGKKNKLGPLAASRNKLLEPIANPAIAVKKPTDHWKDWLEGIKLGDPAHTATNAEAAHRSTAACSLGHMCMKAGRAISWDTRKETTGDAALDRMMTPFSRGPYDLRRILKRAGWDIEKLQRA